MREIALFGEDVAHETLLSALLTRFSHNYSVGTAPHVFSSRGGMTRVHFEFDRYLKDVEKGLLKTPDLIVIATDSNCMGYVKRKQQLEKVALDRPTLKDKIVYAIPDPHVERWLLAVGV